MIKKTAIITLVLATLIISAINVNAYDTTITINDEINDVIMEDDEGNFLENYSYPNVDIDELKCVQTGKKVEITFKIHDDGKIENSMFTMYIINLITTGQIDEYNIIIMDATSSGETDSILIEDSKGEKISPISFSGLNTNKAVFSFNLRSNTERLIGIMAITMKYEGNSMYFDAAPDDFDETFSGMTLYPDAGDSYEINVGEKIQFSASLEEGDPSDYNWLWVIDDTSIELEGQNPLSSEFKTKDTYTGRLYVYDGQGNWGMDYFEIDVVSNSSSPNGNGNNNQPGFELIIVIAAVAIALLIFRKKKK